MNNLITDFNRDKTKLYYQITGFVTKYACPVRDRGRSRSQMGQAVPFKLKSSHAIVGKCK